MRKRIEKSVYLSYKDEEINAQFVGSSTPGSDVYQGPLEAGSLLTEDDQGKIVLGKSLAERKDGLDIETGRKLTVRSEKYNYAKKYKVKGLMGRAGAGRLRSTAFITYSDAEKIIGREDVATSIKVLLEDGDPKEFKRQLQQLNVGEIETWREQSDKAANVSQTFSIVTLNSVFRRCYHRSDLRRGRYLHQYQQTSERDGYCKGHWLTIESGHPDIRARSVTAWSGRNCYRKRYTAKLGHLSSFKSDNFADGTNDNCSNSELVVDEEPCHVSLLAGGWFHTCLSRFKGQHSGDD